MSRVLFVPSAYALLSHVLPLIALSERLPARHERCFLVPAPLHETFKNLGLPVLHIDYEAQHMFRAEMKACGMFRPDVLVDDMSATALLATKMSAIPRVSIRRTGVFPGDVPVNPAHTHSMGTLKDFAAFYRNAHALGVTPPTNLAEVCDAAMSIIPGIPALEVLPRALEGHPTYVFAGPLDVSDSIATMVTTRMPAEDPDAIDRFCDRHAQRPIAYFSLGLVYSRDLAQLRTDRSSDTKAAVGRCIDTMLDAGWAVISSVPLSDLHEHRHDRVFHRKILPMHHICSRVDLMVHHCGSGTYQYSILHTLPSICIGSQCFDRDDVARRLSALGAAKYVPSAHDEPDFERRFGDAFETCAQLTGTWHRAAKTCLAWLKAESDRVGSAFDVERVLQRAIELEGTPQQSA